MEALLRVEAKKLLGCSPTARLCRLLFGLDLETIFAVWRALSSSNALRAFPSLAPVHLLWTLYFLRCYPLQAQLEKLLGVTSKTFNSHIWDMLKCLNRAIDSVRCIAFGFRSISLTCDCQIRWCDRRICVRPTSIAHFRASCIVDTTPYKICCPASRRDAGKFWNSHYKQHCLKYEVAIMLDAARMKIVWVSGPFAGSVHDLTIASTKFNNHLSLVRTLRQARETAVADKGYIGSPQFVCPPRGNMVHHHDGRSALLSHRWKVEAVNHRLKTWKILKMQFRHDLSKHQLCFMVVAKLVNLSL